MLLWFILWLTAEITSHLSLTIGAVHSMAATFGSGMFAAALDQVKATGVSLQDVAAIIAASAGVISALTALILGLRTRDAREDKDELRDELIKDLLLERLQHEHDHDGWGS